MTKLKVVNIKCGGCENSIKRILGKQGLTEIKVSPETQTVEFNGDEVVARKILTGMGYPAADSPEAKSLLKKAQSYVSCLIGRIKK
ncbi:MAG: heavy metal-associated domain-containing protein [Candidatus Beckwithbacteria bacterium]|nr:heavy metal-associated domain-containing protein [Candidatus Beckwithbacteria bacterium]